MACNLSLTTLCGEAGEAGGGEGLRPVLRYHGGKWKLADWIISYFPRHRADGARPRTEVLWINDRAWRMAVSLFSADSRTQV